MEIGFDEGLICLYLLRTWRRS
uniref:Uncharacterized protein n=1 Tax=Rhizophora mucronata TaxID=61149 RepID=A0A2P2QUN9_RHIMU